MLEKWQKLTSLSFSIDFHNDRLFGLGLKYHMEIFRVARNSFKKATQKEIMWNCKHMDELMKRYDKEVGEYD